jgi:hypothetical protein
MSDMYGPEHRDLQDQFETRGLADRLEEIIVKTEFEENEKAFIESQNMFFLTTINQEGHPTVSYKGGAKGFVQLINETTLAFPSYDGNGMFYSMGNIVNKPEVGMLFINFETPNRLRVHGTASIDKEDPLLDYFKEAELVVRVKLSKLWINCPRYIHKMQQVEQNRYVPTEGEKTPLASWKHIDLVQDVLPPKDQGRPEKEGGIITIEEWMEDVGKGEA